VGSQGPAFLFMARTPRNTIRELNQEIQDPLNRMNLAIYREIVKTTPKRSGAASRSWTTPEKVTPENFNGIITTSSLPYVERLEAGYSKQAPDGFIQPSIDRVTRRYNK